MTPRRYDIAFEFLCYSSNGGYSAHTKEIRHWWGETLLKCKTDPDIAPHVGRVLDGDPSDTPVPLVRNACVQEARAAKADILVFVDSDNTPDIHFGQPGAKRFFESSFKFLREHWERGPVVIGAPYCGPPPHENVYVFQWGNIQSDNPQPQHSLDQFTREQAALMSGITPVGALPTGLIMFDMRLFDLLEPPYFDYEYRDKYHAEKISTEDVVTTRDMSLVACHKLGYNPVFCNWDSWAGHWKPKCVPKPQLMCAEDISKRFVEAINRNTKRNQRVVFFGDPLDGQRSNGHGDTAWRPQQRVALKSATSLDGSKPPEESAECQPSSSSPSLPTRSSADHES